jgi:hypothetical protein
MIGSQLPYTCRSVGEGPDSKPDGRELEAQPLKCLVVRVFECVFFDKSVYKVQAKCVLLGLFCPGQQQHDTTNTSKLYLDMVQRGGLHL